MALSSRLLVLYAFLLGIALLLPGASAERTGRADYRRETNAERFAWGLPPMKPVKRYEPTRVGPALARRSIQPPITGVLAGYAAGATTPTCYLTNSWFCDTNLANAMHFSAAMQSNPQNIVATDPGLLGNILYFKTDFADLGPTVENVGYIGSPDTVHNTAPGATAAYDIYSSPTYWYETAIWNVALDGAVTAIWINPTGSTNGPSVPLVLYTVPIGNYLQATVDPAAVVRDAGTVLELRLQ